jgi:anaerobic selenocysteine-containing dehydrogenase
MSGVKSSSIHGLLRQVDGPLTRDLVREPAGFGLGQVPHRLVPNNVTSMVCGFCSTGCSLDIHLRDGQAINLSPTTDYPVNRGVACPKGWESLNVLDSPNRAVNPLARDANGDLVAIEWDDALDHFCDHFKSIQRSHGNASVAFLSTGQIPTEEMALLGAVAKFGMGMVHGDGNTRQCMATAATAYKQSFGFDAPPYTYLDFEESDVIVLVGSNLCVAHPIMWERICRNQRNPKIVVIDPRLTETAAAATHHLALRPKSDLTLFYGLANLLIQRDRIDREFIAAATVNFDAYSAHVRPFSLDRVSSETGLSHAQILNLVGLIGGGERVSFWWTMGVNQSYEGVRTAQSLINLALMTGNIGKPGTGANSITGQCNAMGSRLFSNTTNLLGGRNFENSSHREEVAQILDIPVANIPTENSWPYHRILEGIDRGEIRGLWIVCTNPAHSWIHQDEARKRLAKLDYLVVQDIYANTETAQLADLVLPAAGWGEKEGTFINSERRWSAIRRVSPAPGEALADFFIFRLVAERWGCGEMFRRWQNPEDVFHLLRDLSRGQPCDISGISGYSMLTRSGGIQWPCPETHDATPTEPATIRRERRLFEDRRFFHRDGKAKFIFDDIQMMPDAPDDEYPYLLMTGRGSVAQWHTQTRTSQSALLRTLYPPSSYIEMHPSDADRERIASGDHITVTSRHGSLETAVFVATSVRPGQLFLPMHYESTNRLTKPHFDPHSHQPSYKNCAVRIASSDAPQVP